mmetsp:Transcript_5397/g.9064  ORF Transcript_5397/g.9064 Transcript_5397/m.9064 type:complete len:198 (-) Transcript_5397:532-1125(-)
MVSNWEREGPFSFNSAVLEQRIQPNQFIASTVVFFDQLYFYEGVVELLNCDSLIAAKEEVIFDKKIQFRCSGFGRAISLQSGTLIEGKFEEGRLEGFGRQVFNHCCRENKDVEHHYLGYFKEGLRHGEGTMFSYNSRLQESLSCPQYSRLDCEWECDYPQKFEEFDSEDEEKHERLMEERMEMGAVPLNEIQIGLLI